MSAMSTEITEVLPGQATLLACWEALARLSPGARLVETPGAIAAVFPSWAPLNNALLLSPQDPSSELAAAAAVSHVYADAGVPVWALWRSSRATDLEAADRAGNLAGLERDTTTLVMHAALTSRLSPTLERYDEVVPASIGAVAQFDEEVRMTPEDLGSDDGVPGLSGWALVHEGQVVSTAWTFEHQGDCGVYAVETLSRYRRRGFAKALMEHLLAAAQQRGARTASLQSTRMGQPLYATLGFTPAGRYEEWISQ